MNSARNRVFGSGLRAGCNARCLRASLCRRVKLAGLRHALTEEQIAALARAAHGFVGADIAALCNEAAMAALRRHVTCCGAKRAFFISICNRGEGKLGSMVGATCLCAIVVVSCSK